MAIDLGTYTEEQVDSPLPPRDPSTFSIWHGVKQVLDPIASLRLTVVLFALSIVLILAGTFAQVEKDIWEVVGQYFRCWFARIPFVVFFPPSFVPEMPTNPEEVTAFGRFGISTMQWLKQTAESCGSFWFPGGKLIGLLLAANLLAAHIVRFKVQSRGTRLLAGIAALVVGVAVNWFVITAAGNADGFQAKPWIPYSTLWIGYRGLMLFLCLGTGYVALSTYSMLVGQRKTVPQKCGISLLVTMCVGFGILSGLTIVGGDDYRPSDASMRILWQLTQGMIASAALLAGCWTVFGKRAGIVLLHSGVGLMMFYELHVAMTAIETQMQIEEGETTNFVSDIRTYELAITDKSDPDQQHVTTIPKSMLTKERNIDLPNLPFTITVKDIIPSSHMRAVTSQDSNPATEGIGRDWFAESKRAGAGTDTDSKIDYASAYVTLTNRADGKPIGTYLVGMLLSMSDEIDSIRADGKPFELTLRPKRYYKPYHFRLKDVRKEDYLGTSTPRSYASTVHIDDKSRHVDETKTIWMNNPLRFANETFYQSNYFPATASSDEQTVFSVVANTGWMMPYVACMLVGLGMAVHFLTILVRFLMRSESLHPEATTSRLAQKLNLPIPKPKLEQVTDSNRRPWIAAITVAAATMLVVVGAIPPKKKDLDYDFYRFGQIPVVQDGRAKPIDSAAYSALLTISGRTKVEIGEEKDKHSIGATRWLLDVISENRIADDYHVFKVENLEVQEVIGVKKREGMRYSRREIGKRDGELRKQVELASEVGKKDKRQLSVFQRKILELNEKIVTYDTLKFAFNLHRRIGGDTPEEVVRSFQEMMRLEQAMTEGYKPIFAIPPLEDGEKWRTFTGASLQNIISEIRKQGPIPTVKAWDKIFETYLASEMPSTEDKKAKKAGPVDFNLAVDSYLKLLHDEHPRDLNLAATGFEAYFNHLKPFTQADILYLFAFIVGACGWLGWTRGFNVAALSVLCVAFVVHTFAIVGRIYISGRPPVTNLYSSAVFIGWGCVLLGMLLEVVYRLGVGNLIASVAGYATLLIADGLALGGDTFTVLTAVLDTQFWLATHVTTITLGYATTYLAGLLGVVYVVRGVLTPSLTPAISKDISRMIYGTLCFSLFFSFIGTVLGGLWADDSWGRFWGWDPKENGALIIVLWNALVLHARWGGIVKERGMAVLAIAGNIFVSWSWWGVNELGAGLHSYGFTAGTVLKLGAFVASQLVLIGIGSIPRRLWFSTRRNAAAS